MSVKISIGCDPELFLRKKSTGEFVSAHDLMPGTKLKPHPVDLGAVQVDGVAAEFNIDPTFTPGDFITNISTVMSKLQSLVGEDYELVSQPTVEFSSEYFKSLPSVVRELGCNPDFNAWTGQINPKPDGESTYMRTAAGHIHIGWCKDADIRDQVHFEDCQTIAKQLDHYLGLYSLQWDPDTKRRQLYGKAGSFRPKPYGMEYRPLSNVWLRTAKLQQWVWNSTHKAIIDLVQNGLVLEEEFGDSAREVIDNSIQWWTPEGAKTNKAVNKLYSKLALHTGLENPPPLPKESDNKVVNKPDPKHKYEFQPDFSKNDDPSWAKTVWDMHVNNSNAAASSLVRSWINQGKI